MSCHCEERSAKQSPSDEASFPLRDRRTAEFGQLNARWTVGGWPTRIQWLVAVDHLDIDGEAGEAKYIIKGTVLLMVVYTESKPDYYQCSPI
jgi:hypothetical protein